MKYFLRMVLLCVLSGVSLVYAHGEHGKPQYGGIFGEAVVFQTELLLRDGKAVLYLSEHGQPLPSRGGSARLLILSGSSKVELTLQAVADNRFEATLPQPLAAGSKIVASVTLADKRSGNARFVLP